MNICPNVALKAASGEHMWKKVDWNMFSKLFFVSLGLLSSSDGLIQSDMALLLWLPLWLGLCLSSHSCYSHYPCSSDCPAGLLKHAGIWREQKRKKRLASIVSDTVTPLWSEIKLSLYWKVWSSFEMCELCANTDGISEAKWKPQCGIHLAVRTTVFKKKKKKKILFTQFLQQENVFLVNVQASEIQTVREGNAFPTWDKNSHVFDGDSTFCMRRGT